MVLCRRKLSPPSGFCLFLSISPWNVVSEREQNREYTKEYSRWKVEWRHGKFKESAVSTIVEHKEVPKRGTEPGVWNSKRSLLVCHTRCKCSMEREYNECFTLTSIFVHVEVFFSISTTWRVSLLVDYGYPNHVCRILRSTLVHLFGLRSS